MTNSSGNGPNIVVIGAGITGASIAFHLSLRNANVTLIDADKPGQAASHVSFAWINGRDKNPRHYHDLNRRSIDMWSRFERRLGGDIGLTWGGELRWAATQYGAEEMGARIKELQSWGYPIRYVEPSEFKQMEPNLDAGTVTAASFTDIDGHVETSKVIQACLDRATERGVEVRSETRVTNLRLGQTVSGETRVEGLETDKGEIPCDIAILATGADTAEVAATAGIEIHHHWTFGATLITHPVAQMFQSAAVVHSARDLPGIPMNFRQWPDGSLMIHGGPHGGSGDESQGKTDEEVEQVFQAAKQFLPSLEGASIKEVRRGRRPMPEDGLPILGFSESVPNLYFATMHSGVSLAALVGEFAAIEVLDDARIDILEPYRVERFTQ